ncbi:hypothetical protein F4778DRAFT_790586 [Xylariomycetidae sp. FL2044]|nr:hypothetical protein F4778DRAFT_790586 [Xylariomycetidae sp. FL2044]
MASLNTLFNHIVLPVDIPGNQDENLESIEDELLRRMHDACTTLQDVASREGGYAAAWSETLDALVSCHNLDSRNTNYQKFLQSEFLHLKPGGYLLLHVAEQNAALIIRRKRSTDHVIFEVFETSPSCEKVLASQGSLLWDFPGRAVEIPLTIFFGPSFQQSLSEFLEKANSEPLERFAARITKAGVSVAESRDTPSPGLIVEMLMPLLEALGCSVNTSRIRKRVRDDVNIRNAQVPWRRLPFWLVLRVGIQRRLQLKDKDIGRACYKTLMIVMLSQFLRDCVGSIPHERAMTLRTKVCGRLAKLELEKSQLDEEGTLDKAYKCLLDRIKPIVGPILDAAHEQVEKAWTHFKLTTTRTIPELPSTAPKSDCDLTLRNSTAYLQRQLIRRPRHARQETSEHRPPQDGAVKHFDRFAERYLNLFQTEADIRREFCIAFASPDNPQDRCLRAAAEIASYIQEVGDAYKGDKERLSEFLLVVFELWVYMDKFAISSCPLLRRFHPVFTPELLDVLQFSEEEEVRRLNAIQVYIRNRCEDCVHKDKTIFSEAGSRSFAVEYVRQSTALTDLRWNVRTGSSEAVICKELEWRRIDEEYLERTEGMYGGVCVCRRDVDGNVDVRGCTRCWHERKRRKLRISVHEDYLPEDEFQADSVIFELGIPHYLEDYRNATWRIICDFACPNGTSSAHDPAPVMLLEEYEPLQDYRCDHVEPPLGITLASLRKSFLETHYKGRKFPVAFPEIIFPSALNYAYYDKRQGVWVRKLDRRLSLQHLFGIHVPAALHSIVVPPERRSSTYVQGLSSYEIVSSQTKCPSQLSPHEFTAYLQLLSGGNRRWLTILRELGSSNLNLNTEDSMLVFSQLANEAGPITSSGIREWYTGFKDPGFCSRLAEIIGQRLRDMESNWREVHSMELLITLIHRLVSVETGERAPGFTLLGRARSITLGWVDSLRVEMMEATEAGKLKTISRYRLWAAMLCRRTFEQEFQVQGRLDRVKLCNFVRASLAYQESITSDPRDLPLTLRNALVRDTHLMFRLRPLLRDGFRQYRDGISSAIQMTWSDANETEYTLFFTDWCFLPGPSADWIMSTMKTEVQGTLTEQHVHYNIVGGHLLVGGRIQDKLPPEIRDSAAVQDVFGQKHLLTYPSNIQGMTHMLVSSVHGQIIYFGVREGEIIIQALSSSTCLQYVPRGVFGNQNGSSLDLPASLVENCIHWLDLDRQRVLVRRKPNIWVADPDQWTVHIRGRTATRGPDYRLVTLVDPHSPLASRVAGIFDGFLYPPQLEISQPRMGSLTVNIRHLELSFIVNKNKRLGSPELSAEVDPDQDAGTFYGFKSKLVIRDIDNPARRSMITASGGLIFSRHGMHVSVTAAAVNDYFTFRIDDVLGRLSCPPEPRLLYFKAYVHAVTSFVLPDPLTKRTGTEEAINILSSGNAQPWTPLAPNNIRLLQLIACLSPRREYYPRDKKLLQTIYWDEDLTTSIQHDSFERITDCLLSRSKDLAAFSTVRAGSDTKAEATPHLRRRGESQRLRHERLSECDIRIVGEDETYVSRDREATATASANVFSLVRSITATPFVINNVPNLQSFLSQWEVIGGFGDIETPTLKSLTDLMSDDVGDEWGSIVNFCRATRPHEKYRLIFRLCLLAFSDKVNMDIVHALSAFGCLEGLQSLAPPAGPVFTDVKLRNVPSAHVLSKLAEKAYPEFNSRVPMKRRQNSRLQYNTDMESECSAFAQHLLGQWPSRHPTAEGFEKSALDIETAMVPIQEEWERRYLNFKFLEFLTNVRNILGDARGKKTNAAAAPRMWRISSPAYYRSSSRPILLSLARDLLTKEGPALGNSEKISDATPEKGADRSLDSDSPPSKIKGKTHTASSEIAKLADILADFSTTEDAVRRQYGSDLQASLRAYETTCTSLQYNRSRDQSDTAETTEDMARENIRHGLQMIHDAMAKGGDHHLWLRRGNLWPCVDLVTILEQLRSKDRNTFGPGMKEAIVVLGLAVTELQAVMRLRHYRRKKDLGKISEESRNVGHENWNPTEYPDWLLLEIEGDILIRRGQVDVAKAIVSPTSQANSVLQMNMGQGKTSCILPMAAALLANQQQLTRIIVPKALLLPTAQLMQARLGGMIGREILHIPFSRQTQTTPDLLQLYAGLHAKTLRRSGIMVTSPDHVLSFKLSGLQKLVDAHGLSSQPRLAKPKMLQASQMIKFQSWLGKNCRDILDECDFTLAVKTQLIYPSGAQEHVDGHPQRWKVAQDLLALVEGHLPSLKREFPDGVWIVDRNDRFPMAHFSDPKAEDALQDLLVKDICQAGLSGLRATENLSAEQLLELTRCLLDDQVDLSHLRQAASYFSDRNAAYKVLLHVRGLLRYKILYLALKKRWNVQYGFHPERDTLAVPFEAKGVPSEQAEFGHPDVAILLTCLSFYYAGVSLPQFRKCLQYVLQADDPIAEYNQLIGGCSGLPQNLVHWNVINVEDHVQAETLHARQFRVKLQASGWDLPLFSHTSSQQRARTTGFSGTNDVRFLLPKTIKQDDLPSLHHTNAEVLTYLLQERNTNCVLAADSEGRVLSEIGLLQALTTRDIHILIDAGAYILEMDNESIASQWLRVNRTAKAAIYFKNDNRAWVKYRGGSKEDSLLIASQFADQLLDKYVLVYLDQAHTRGIDLKFHPDAHGALTLGPEQTKDHTVQGAMRLRQLGTTQSVTFFAPLAVYRSILDVRGKQGEDHVDSADVVFWLMEQTCAGNAQLQKLHNAQGKDFCRRLDAAITNPNYLTEKSQFQAYVQVLEQPEQQSLEQLYGDERNEADVANDHGLLTCKQLRSFVKKLEVQSSEWDGVSRYNQVQVLEEVEQEREVEFQVEDQREVANPVHKTALEFPGRLDPSIEEFLETGVIPQRKSFVRAFTAVSKTAIGKRFRVKPGPRSDVYVTHEFTRTIKARSTDSCDGFLRMPEWILWSPSKETAVVIIPEEADLVIPKILARGKSSKVHLITYAAPVTRSMLPLGDLTFHSIPSLPRGHVYPRRIVLELGLFAGRLYINFADYEALGRLLDQIVQSKDIRGFLLDWMALRRKGQHVLHTPMGYLCQSRKLTADHPFFRDQ